MGNCYYQLPLKLQDAVAKANEILKQERWYGCYKSVYCVFIFSIVLIEVV